MSRSGILIAPAQYRDWFSQFVKEVATDDVRIHFADSVAALTSISETANIDFVLLGGSTNENEWRLEILRAILTQSPMTSVHCKGEGSDGEQFVRNVLKGFLP